MKGIIIVSLALIAMAAAKAPVCPEQGNDLAIFPNPDDCTSFYVCDEEIPILMKCDPGLWFNPVNKVCDFPENVQSGVCVPPEKK